MAGNENIEPHYFDEPMVNAESYLHLLDNRLLSMHSRISLGTLL